MVRRVPAGSPISAGNTGRRAASAAPPGLRAEVAFPHVALRPFVSRYVQVALDLPAGSSLQHPLSALTGSVATVLWSGQVTMRGAGIESRIASSCLIGPLTRWHDNQVTGSLRTFCVHFTPLGANLLLQLHGCNFQDRAVAFGDVLDGAVAARACRWSDQVAQAAGFAARIALADRFLLDQLCRARAHFDLVAAAIAQIGQAREGVCRVSRLATGLACSERTLRRRFHEELGISLKRFARITRFRQAHAFLQGAGGADWASAIARFGYVDQAHLIHEYREFAGTTPARFRTDERFLDNALTLR